MKYKIVDWFNGHEDDRRFATEVEAEEVMRKEFVVFMKRFPATEYCKKVVREDSQWICSSWRGFVWS